MKTTKERIPITRRQLFKATAGVTAGLALPRSVWAQGCEAKEGTVRDRLWLFGVPVNVDNLFTGRRSLMTHVEGALYLGIPNMVMVCVQHPRESPHGSWSPWEPPYDQLALGLRPFKRVWWSLVGSAGVTKAEERPHIMELAKRTPNFTGLFLDDFFYGKEVRGKHAPLTVDELRAIRDRAKGPGKKLDIGVTYYLKYLDVDLTDYLNLIDVISIWTSRHQELLSLEANFGRIEKLLPTKRKMLGCYFIDYGQKEPVTVAEMRHQCELGLRWLREGRIEGMIFLDNSEVDIGLECVEWAREWIQKVGDTKL